MNSQLAMNAHDVFERSRDDRVGVVAVAADQMQEEGIGRDRHEDAVSVASVAPEAGVN